MKRFAVLTICTAGLAACATNKGSPVDPEPSRDITLSLSQDENGDLEICDANNECIGGLPNPCDCAVLEVSIDTSTGATEEECRTNDGQVRSDCQGSSVECVLITIPEPDCTVCAYVNGAVIFSDCHAEEPPPDDCATYTAAGSEWQQDPSGGSGGGTSCKRCYDANGYPIIDECGTDCSNTVCPQVLCADGYQPTRYPGECCERCEPVNDCSQWVCPTDGVPDCGPGYYLVQDSRDCCTYRCEPSDCSNVACPDVVQECPAGYTFAAHYPDCCGSCYPDSEPTYCDAQTPCPDGYTCSVETVCSCEPDATGSCDPNSGSTERCYGWCKPIGHTCEAYPQPTTGCAGWWDSGGRDQYGCPLPPACHCYDGSISRDGTCADSCANVYCAEYEQVCPVGEHLEYGYPYCCGACVPDGQCWTASDGTMSNGGTACPAVACEPGFHEEIGGDCCPTCVQDPIYCASDLDCQTSAGSQSFCSTRYGDCYRDPSCANSDGTICNSACYGTCVTQ